ncbi:hypothetical protein Q3G72_021849 [Acer saccharum]|nr:hypothetical protein Q3G72_021849 [Acer saccharum]
MLRNLPIGLAKVHKQPCHIVYTDYQPTSLQHYIFPAGGLGLYLVVDEKGKFREDSFHREPLNFDLCCMMAKMDLTVDDEKVNIESIFWSAMDMLSDDDKKLPQARYHFFPKACVVVCLKYVTSPETWNRCASFWLPILKEVIEILFQEGLLKVFEGSLIRAIRGLEEVLQQLILAAKSIGETELESKFEDACCFQD